MTEAESNNKKQKTNTCRRFPTVCFANVVFGNKDLRKCIAYRCKTI